MVILLVESASCWHRGFFEDQYLICRFLRPVLCILIRLQKLKKKRKKKTTLEIIFERWVAYTCRCKRRTIEEFQNCTLPYSRYFQKLRIVTGIHSHDRFLEEMNLRQLTYLTRVKHLFDVRIRRVWICVISEDTLANLFDTFLDG